VWCEAKQVWRRNDDTLCSGNNGTKAREEVTKVLRRFGCESIGFMDDFEKHEVLLAFTHRGRQVQLNASAKRWAQMYLKENPWTYSRRSQRVEYEQAALRHGHIAVNSVLRDWIKGQITAIECGILSFEAVFTPYMLTSDGRPPLHNRGLVDSWTGRPNSLPCTKKCGCRAQDKEGPPKPGKLSSTTPFAPNALSRENTLMERSAMARSILRLLCFAAAGWRSWPSM
jgi:hypothetical protein